MHMDDMWRICWLICIKQNVFPLINQLVDNRWSRVFWRDAADDYNRDALFALSYQHSLDHKTFHAIPAQIIGLELWQSETFNYFYTSRLSLKINLVGLTEVCGGTVVPDWFDWCIILILKPRHMLLQNVLFKIPCFYNRTMSIMVINCKSYKHLPWFNCSNWISDI